MSIRADLIAIGIAGVVVVAAGWYAKKKITGTVTGVKDSVTGAIKSFDGAVDGTINAAGQYITGDAGWTYWGGHSPQYNHQFDGDFGVIPGSGW